MPIHDWTRVDAGIFHHFHQTWVVELGKALNSGVLPPDFYALVEQVTGRGTPDLLALTFTGGPVGGRGGNGVVGPAAPGGGVTVAAAPPKVRFRETATPENYARRARSLVIRHRSEDRIVAMVEVVSPGNKGSRADFRAFVEKAVAVVRGGINLLVLDLFPPGPRDPQGVHAAIWSEFTDHTFALPADKPLTLAAYAAGDVLESFVEPVAVGDTFPEAIPLFLTPDLYVPAPLEATYAAAWATVPARWRQVVTG